MLDFTIERRGEACVVRLNGELDLSEAARLSQALAAAEADSPTPLVLDLRRLTFIDSSGLRAILEADIRARRDARRLVLIPGPETVHRIFLIALLDKRLEFATEWSEWDGDGATGAGAASAEPEAGDRRGED